ncbi:MAG TPA: TMEM175 family protein [Ktedonosporobacter sp.]|nr:TMEM175 family protein [Ktedonosporobacter sp.]
MEIQENTQVVAEEDQHPREDRIILFSDGIFAIVITLLVLNVQLPDAKTTVEGALMALLPKFIGYIVSFSVVAIYWFGHRRLVLSLKRIDERFILLHLIFLFLILSLPVPYGFLGQSTYPDPHHVLALLYTLTLAASGFALGAMASYAAWKRRLIDRTMAQTDVNYSVIHNFIVPTLLVLSLITYLLPIPSYAIYYCWALIPVAFILVKSIYHHKNPTGLS